MGCILPSHLFAFLNDVISLAMRSVINKKSNTEMRTKLCEIWENWQRVTNTGTSTMLEAHHPNLEVHFSLDSSPKCSRVGEGQCCLYYICISRDTSKSSSFYARQKIKQVALFITPESMAGPVQLPTLYYVCKYY